MEQEEVYAYLAIYYFDTFTNIKLSFFVDIFASTAFSRQLINDDPNGWDMFFNITKSNCSEIQNIPYSDISSISYSSDGRYLNITYWLSGKFENQPTQLFRSPTYTVGLAIISDDRTPEIDYIASVRWDSVTRTWTKTIDEILGNNHRILYEEHDYKISYDNSIPSANLSAVFNIPLTIEKGHLNLSLDIRSLSNPSKYFLIFSCADTIMQKGGNLCGVVDLVDNFGIVPFPRFDISTSKRNIELRPW